MSIDNRQAADYSFLHSSLLPATGVPADRVDDSVEPASVSMPRAQLCDSATNGQQIDSLKKANPLITVIERRKGWKVINWREIVLYRDLFRFLVWREIKVRYAQSTIGVGWAIVQPLVSMLIFTFVFGHLANVSSEGAPYSVFSLTALIPWMYFSNSLVDGANSLITNASMLRKVYFPRVLMPLSAVAARILDFLIASCVLACLMIWFGITPNLGVLILPFLLVLMVLTAAGLSLWLTALAVQYRDVKHAMSFVVQLMMYAAPVVYPTSLIPSQYQLVYAMNPMVGVIESFRACLLGTREMPWSFLAVGTMSSLAIATFGLIYFRSKERLFADVA